MNSETLILRISAPLMSWGDRSQYTLRHTAPDPSRSAIQGLLAAAAGTTRDAKIPDWIINVDMAIRIDRPGQILRDYHTINPVPTMYAAAANLDLGDMTLNQGALLPVVSLANGGARINPVITERFYRTDAVYLVAIADPAGNILRALRSPTFTLYAGRKACALSAPFLLGTTPLTPQESVRLLPSAEREKNADLLRCQAVLFTETIHDAVRTETRRDQLVATGEHVRQTRSYIEVDVPVLSDWFTVASTLNRPNNEGRACG